MQTFNPPNINQNIFEMPLSIDDFEFIQELSMSKFGKIVISKYKKQGVIMQ